MSKIRPVSKIKIYSLISILLTQFLLVSPVVPLLDRELGKMLVLGAAEEENHGSKEGHTKQLDKSKLLHKIPFPIGEGYVDRNVAQKRHPYQFSVSEPWVESIDPPPERSGRIH